MTATARTPRWLAEKIALAARKAETLPCPNCGQPVLAGLDNDPCGQPAVADTTPVTYLRALVGHLAGLDVYAVQFGELNRLDDIQLTHGGPSLPLHVQHTCPDPTAA